MRSLALLSPVVCLCALLTGCAGLTAPTSSKTATAGTVSGSIHGGQQPISGASLTIYAAGTTGYGSASTALSSAISSTAGNFSIATPDCSTVGPSATLYILAQGGDSGTGPNSNIMLGAALGPCGTGLPTFISINEVSTAAMAYAMGQFFTPNLGGNNSVQDTFGAAADQPLPLSNAAQYTVPMLANIANGHANQPSTTGTLTTTLDPAKLNSVANTIAACVNTNGVGGASQNCATLFALTTPPGTAMVSPGDTLQAAVQMSLYPYQNVPALFNLASGAGAPFIGLTAQPTDWTLGVSYTSTAFGLNIAAPGGNPTSSSLDIDSTGNVWFPTNTAAAHGLAVWNPATGAFAGPYATGLISPQYVVIDNGGTVWASDMAAGQVLGVTATAPTTTAAFTITPAGTDSTGPMTVAPAYTGAAVSGYGLSVVTDAGGAGGVSSFSGITFLSSAPITGTLTGLVGDEADSSETIALAASNTASAPCVLGRAATNNGFAPALTSAPPCQSGGVLNTFNTNDVMMTATVNASGGLICSQQTASCFAPPVALYLPQGTAIDGNSNIWVANSQPANASVSTFGYLRASQGKTTDYFATSTTAYLHGTGAGGTMTTPYGLAIDRAGNVWISNAGCIAGATACMDPASFTLSELIGAAAPTTTPLSAQNATATNAGNTIGIRP